MYSNEMAGLSNSFKSVGGDQQANTLTADMQQLVTRLQGLVGDVRGVRRRLLGNEPENAAAIGFAGETKGLSLSPPAADSVRLAHQFASEIEAEIGRIHQFVG